MQSTFEFMSAHSVVSLALITRLLSTNIDIEVETIFLPARKSIELKVQRLWYLEVHELHLPIMLMIYN